MNKGATRRYGIGIGTPLGFWVILVRRVRKNHVITCASFVIVGYADRVMNMYPNKYHMRTSFTIPSPSPFFSLCWPFRGNPRINLFYVLTAINAARIFRSSTKDNFLAFPADLVAAAGRFANIAAPCGVIWPAVYVILYIREKRKRRRTGVNRRVIGRDKRE